MMGGNAAGAGAGMGGTGGVPPRGPRAGMGGPQSQPNSGGGTGPMRSHGTNRPNTYHPYSRT